MKKISLIICVLFLSGAKLFNAHEFILDNGLRLIVVENNKAPIIKQMLWYNVGAADEQPTAKGSAHFLEHLMFRGSNFNELTEKHGIEVNAFTGQDYTAYHEFMDISKLELALYLEAKRMKKLEFSDEEFATEKEVVWQERKQVIENNPLSKFSEYFNKTFWQSHPYSEPITGHGDEIKNLTKEDVMSLHNTYYVPNNATLVLAGNIKPELALSLVKKYFDKIPAKEVPTKKEYNSDYLSNANFTMSIEGINTPRFIKRFQAPKNSYALELFAKYLTDGKTSYLYQKMIEKDKSALSISASYNGLAKFGSSLSISATPIKKFDINKLIQEALDNLDEKQLENTKKKMTASFVFLKDNPSDEAYILGALASSGMSLEEIENYEQTINNVTLDDIKEVVTKMLKYSSLQGEIK
ncbi:MAG: pitrilysin family protein [Alphaproteobacteria bacterium]